MLAEKEFRNIFSRGMVLSRIDTIRDTLKVIEQDGLKYMLIYIIKSPLRIKSLIMELLMVILWQSLMGQNYLEVIKNAVQTV